MIRATAAFLVAGGSGNIGGIDDDGAYGRSLTVNRFPNFLPMNGHILRGGDAQSDLIATDFNYRRDEIVSLKPGKVLVIDFNQEAGGITLQ